MNLHRKENSALIIIKEIIIEFIFVPFGNVSTKIGLSVLLLIFSAVCFFSPVVSSNGDDLNKPIIFYIIGFGLLIISFYLIYKRYNEIKNQMEINNQ